MINNEVFKRYEKIRQSGVTNMMDVKTVSLLAAISREECYDIMKNYSMYKEEYLRIDNFTDIICEFVDENFIADSCRECHEIGHSLVPDDHKGSFDKAVIKLMEKITLSYKPTIMKEMIKNEINEENHRRN